MKKSRKKRVDFLPNRQNRYAIRRFSVGTASILVGATLIFGIHSNDASAAVEDATSQEAETTNGNSNSIEEATTNENTTVEAPTSEEASTEEKSVEAPTSEEATTEEKSVEAPTSEEATTEEKSVEAPTSEEATTEEKSVEAPTSEEASTEEKSVEAPTSEEATTEEKSVEAPTSEEASTEEKSVEAPTSEEASTEEKSVEAPTSEEASTEEKSVEAPTSEEATTNTPVKEETSSTQENPSMTTPEEQFSNEFNQLTSTEDKTNYTREYLTQNTNLSAEQVDTTVERLNLSQDNATAEDVYFALLKDLADQQDALSPRVTLLATRDSELTNEESIALTENSPMFRAALANSPSGNDVVSEEDNIIVADALANGYIKSQTDATNAANTLSGRAWVVDTGTPATMSNGLTAVPEGTKVYMQWIDTDGAVSPVYQASTTNKLSSSGGSQVGPGAYAFDLREAWVDSNGKAHKYNATSGQYYRLWIDDYKTADGNTATMLRQAGGFFPGSYINSVTGNNIGQFPLIGTNMQRTGVFMGVIPTNDYMTTDPSKWVQDNEGPISNPAVTSTSEFVSGKVWSETGSGDYANSATGPNFNSGDIAREGYQVVMSSLTSAGAQAYKAQVESLPTDQQAAAAHQLFTDHPEFISATVTGKTDASGAYTLRFPSGSLNKDYLYGYVLDNKGNLVKGYSSFTSPLFRSPNSNSSFAPQTAPYHRPAKNAWVNVNFALVETIETTVDITNFDVTANPAQRGDTAIIDVTSTALSPLPTHVEWRDSKGNVVQKSGDVTTVEEAEAAGTFTIPDDAKTGEIYTVYIVSGGNDVAADSLIVQVQENAATYEPVYPTTTVEQDQTVTIPTPTNEDGAALPDGTKFEGGNNVPEWATVNEDGSISISPNQDVEKGNYNVPVVVTYPDGSKETVFAPVLVQEAVPTAEQYDPTSETINKEYGTTATEDEIKGAVTIPDYPTDGDQPTITIDDPTQIPNGTEEGTVNVGVTVTYPDGTTDKLTVPVVTGKQADNDKYTPETTPITKDFGTGVTEDEVKGAVTVPGYPTDGDQPTITIDDPSQLPDGSQEGTTDVDVTVKYPDGTTDHITVPVTVGKQADNDKYTPETEGVNKDHGTPVTEDDVKGSITIPGYPTDGDQPTITIDDPSQLPDGSKEGTTDVSVTVTYPDGTTDHITVPVTIGDQADNDKYTPETTPITKDFGTGVTEDEVKGSVTVPGYPTEGDQPTITIDDPSQLPDGSQEGTTDVSVTVEYPDGTTDHITVPVTVGKQADNDKYTPETTPITKDFGTPVTEDEVKGAVTVPGYPTDGDQPTITIDDPSQLPDGSQEGTTDVSVTITYQDGTTDHITVPVTIGDQADNDKYTPETEGVDKDHDTPVTEDDVKDSITIPGYPTDGDQPTITIDDPSQLPDGSQEGTTDVSVTVTYPDGTTDHITVPVTIGKQADNDKYTPETEGVNKDHGTPITEDDVKGSITIPGYPTDGDQPTITIDDPSQLPDGSQEGTTDVSVTVTYPDGTTDHITVPVTIGKQADNDKYTPETEGVDKDHGTPVTEDEVKDSITIPGYPTDGDQPTITIDDPSQLPDGSKEGTTDVNVTVTYPDGTTDHITVPVTIGKQADNDKYTPETEGVDKGHGTPVTEDDVKDSITIPGYPTDGDQPTITIDDPSQLPDGTKEGTTDVNVTITYPDGTTDHITVPVTIGKQADNDKYTPETEGVNKDHGTPVTEDDVKDSITIPGYPTDGDQPTITIDDPSQLPDGSQEGTTDVNVIITYPDGTTDHITVPVTIGKQPTEDNGATDNDGDMKPGTDETHNDTDNGSDMNQGTDEGHGVTDHDDNVKQNSNGDHMPVEQGDNHATSPATDMDPMPSGSQTTSDDMNAKGSTSEKANHKQQSEQLPDTGESNTQNGALLGGLFAALGGLFLIGRRRKEKEEK
ncbi:TPA: YPDG domain-containing protein [Staphylococcus delphini]|uniref:LPXTG-anchored surface protein SpsF n=1 Tax=Staphylococcus delphini TaxID=53344 RepID=UPI000BBBC5A9|nr:LPXTG-anchored surface protein SpsF [Staphylococcus delphini]PCF46297.1 adhesin [Staphylococcus delphini]HEC2156084.1 YPDG domain-containing protein [Staphylococcus delphini]